ncbi:hypothetical protein LTR94_025378 [Friedmanniomyces endolithicus]|jgi:hypothetical protein|nr:hypothetical protein LTR94_025378 [Friedmanniomyces endolithicus]
MNIPLSIGLVSLLVGMMIQIGAFSFWLGGVSQRVKKLEDASKGDETLNRTVIELKVKMDHLEALTEKLGASMEGVQRQLGNLAMGRVGRGVEFPAE